MGMTACKVNGYGFGQHRADLDILCVRGTSRPALAAVVAARQLRNKYCDHLNANTGTFLMESG